jgi:hypothetical protein
MIKREIKFRALSSSGEWVYGFLVRDNSTPNYAWIHNSDGGAIACPIGTESQFTGLLDKKLKEIYEGDIVECGYGKGEVIFNAGCFMVCWIDDREAYMEFVFSRKGMYRRKGEEEFEVIGNIFENPEIIEQCKNKEL